MRDIDADYKRAYTEEYEAYRRAGRDEDAKHVAGILRDHYDVEAGEDADAGDADGGKAGPERKDAPKPPENATPPKPARGKKTPAKKPDGE